MIAMAGATVTRMKSSPRMARCGQPGSKCHFSLSVKYRYMAFAAAVSQETSCHFRLTKCPFAAVRPVPLCAGHPHRFPIRNGTLRTAEATLLSPASGRRRQSEGRERTSGSGRDGPDLLHQAEEVHAHPALGEQAVLDPPDVDELDLDRGARGRHAHECAFVCGGPTAAGDQLVVLRRQALAEVDPQVGERRLEHGEALQEPFGPGDGPRQVMVDEARRHALAEDLGLALVHALLEEPPHQRLVLGRTHDLPHVLQAAGTAGRRTWPSPLATIRHPVLPRITAGDSQQPASASSTAYCRVPLPLIGGTPRPGPIRDHPRARSTRRSWRTQPLEQTANRA